VLQYVKILLGLAFTVVAAASAHADELGIASYYHNPYHSGMIAAHRTLPFGSHVRVTNLINGKSIVVTIVDRGPFIRGRVIDVSPNAAQALGFRQLGVTRVRLGLL
jgi:rare lipoprotein A